MMKDQLCEFLLMKTDSMVLNGFIWNNKFFHWKIYEFIVKSACILTYSALVELSPSNSACVRECVCASVWISRCWLTVPGCSCTLDSGYIPDNGAELYMTSCLYNSIISVSLIHSCHKFLSHILFFSLHFLSFLFLFHWSCPSLSSVLKWWVLCRGVSRKNKGWVSPWQPFVEWFPTEAMKTFSSKSTFKSEGNNWWKLFSRNSWDCLWSE